MEKLDAIDTALLGLYKRADTAENALRGFIDIAPDMEDEINKLIDQVNLNIDISLKLMQENNFEAIEQVMQTEMESIQSIYDLIRQPIIYDLTPGLLIAIAVRYDYSFQSMHINRGGYPHDSLSQKQKNLLRIAQYYWEMYIDDTIGGIFNGDQIVEEITGTGFYRPELENVYMAMATPDALVEIDAIMKELDDE